MYGWCFVAGLIIGGIFLTIDITFNDKDD